MSSEDTFAGSFFSILARKLIPQNRFGDAIFATSLFLKYNGLIPKHSMTFNDVLYWMKIRGDLSDPLRIFVSDKEFSKLYVTALVGKSYVVPTIAVLKSPEEVDQFEFPRDCCIKPTHASGYVIIRKDGTDLNKARIKTWFHLDYYWITREANYKPLHPKVIVEPLLFRSASVDEYKIFCYKGVPKMIKAIQGRHTNYRSKYFDAKWNELDFSVDRPKAQGSMPCPNNLEEMLSIAATLSAQFSFVRIDFYSDCRQCFVGEITNCSYGAIGQFIPSSGERVASDLIFG